MTQLNLVEQTEAQKCEVPLSISGELNIEDYVQDIAPSQDMVRDVAEWSKAQFEKQQEETRSRIAMLLVKMFGATLVATYVFVGAAAFNRDADKVFIKDITSQVIPPQLALLGAALGYYFGCKKS